MTLKDQRQQFIDLARGSAMMFVLLSHFSFTYFTDQNGLVPTTLRLVGMIASPTFVLINGLLIGFIFRESRKDLPRLRILFTDRGLLLLTVGHVLILGSHLPWYTPRFLSITDSVGVCMLLGPTLAISLRPRARVALGVGAFALSWIAIAWWHPGGLGYRAVEDTLFGNLSSSIYDYSFPLLPWFGLNVVASALGSRLGELHVEDDSESMQRLLNKVAVFALLGAVAAWGAYRIAKYASHGHALVLAVHPLMTPFQKGPPSLVYLLFYGALGMGLLSGSLHVVRRGRAPALVTYATAIGQTSFVVFMIQGFVFFAGLALVREHLPVRWAWPAYFLLSVGAIVCPALAWHRRGYNRFLTVGYRRFKESQAQDPVGDLRGERHSLVGRVVSSH